jgi:hypothetical protein
MLNINYNLDMFNIAYLNFNLSLRLKVTNVNFLRKFKVKIYQFDF